MRHESRRNDKAAERDHDDMHPSSKGWSCMYQILITPIAAGIL